MQLKTVTWNIGGGKHLKEGEDPYLMGSYSVEAVAEIANWLKAANPDIISLQEAHGVNGSNQAEEIAQILGYKYYFFDATSSSHIDEGKLLGNGLISKYPIKNHHTGAFLNPNIRTVFQDRLLISHDKGYSTCSVEMGGYSIQVTTLHLLPFRVFNIELDSQVGQEIVASIVAEISSAAPYRLIQGDFNIDTPAVQTEMPQLFTDGLNEVSLEAPTTPSGRKYDHVLFKGLELLGTNIDSGVQTDHYPVSCTFRIVT